MGSVSKGGETGEGPEMEVRGQGRGPVSKGDETGEVLAIEVRGWGWGARLQRGYRGEGPEMGSKARE